MIAYSYDRESMLYVGETICQPNPMRLGEHLIPANATKVKPSGLSNPKWDGCKWIEHVVEVEPEPPETGEETGEGREERLITLIKNHAYFLISSRFPSHKQRNLIAQQLEVITSTDMTEEEKREITKSCNRIWRWVKKVRAYSNDLEDQIKRGDDIDIYEGWPEYP